MATTVIKDGKLFRIDPKNSKHLQSSPDKGVNWSWGTNLSWEAKEIMVDGKDLIVVSADGKIHISHDNGVNWPITR